MGAEVTIDPRPVRDAYDNIGQATVANDDAYDDLLKFTLRTGFIPRLTLVGVNVDAGAEAYATFRILVNGTPIPHPLYNNFTSAPGIVYDPGQRIIYPIELPQGALIQVQGKISSSASQSYGMYARIRVEYVDVN